VDKQIDRRILQVDVCVRACVRFSVCVFFCVFSCARLGQGPDVRATLIYINTLPVGGARLGRGHRPCAGPLRAAD